MPFALCSAVARCQGRRLLDAARSAPLPAAIVVALVAGAPIALARVGTVVGREIAPSIETSGVALALVLGPCLAAAAAGAVVSVSLARAALGAQISASPCGTRTAIVAPLLVPALVATVVAVPSLLALTLSLAGSLPGGRASGLALSGAVLAAVLVGAVLAEAVRVAAFGSWRGLLLVGLGCGIWTTIGQATGEAALGPLSTVASALEGVVSPLVALGSASAVAVAFGIMWIVVVGTRPEPRPRTVRRRHREARWRFPVPAAVTSLVIRRADIRRATGAALGFGLTGLIVALVAGSASPGPFLLATTTTLLGSLVPALALYAVLASGSWVWRAAPGRLGSFAVIAWLVGLAGAALPVGMVAVAAALSSGVDKPATGVVVVLVVMGAAVATTTGSLVPWHGEGVGDQLSAVAAFMAVGLATSFAVGLIAPRLTSLGLSDPGVALLVCVGFSLLANVTLVRRLAGGT